MAQNKFNINAFASEIGKTGVANPAYFMVMIHLPHKLKYDFAGLEPTLSLRIEQAALPTRAVLTHDQRYYGPSRRIPYGYNSQELALTVILSEDMREREIFMRWQDLMLGKSRTAGTDGRGPITSGAFDVGYYDTAVRGASVELYTYATSPSLQGAAGGPSLFGELKGIAEAVGFDPSKVTNPFGLNLFGTNKDRDITHAYKVKLIEPFPLTINEVPLNWADDGYARLQVQLNYRYFEEKHTTFPDSSPDASIASMVRSGMNTFNKFKPALSLITGQGLGGAARSIAGQIAGGVLGNIKSMTTF